MIKNILVYISHVYHHGQNTDLTDSEFKLSRRNIISFPELLGTGSTEKEASRTRFPEERGSGNEVTNSRPIAIFLI